MTASVPGTYQTLTTTTLYRTSMLLSKSVCAGDQLRPSVSIVRGVNHFAVANSPPAFAHMSMEDDIYNGYYIPSGSIILANTRCVDHQRYLSSFHNSRFVVRFYTTQQHTTPLKSSTLSVS